MNQNMLGSCRKITIGSSALHQLQQQRQDQQFCDVTLKVEDETFNAHRNVLAAVSSYFFKMFTIDMKEKHERVIPIETVTADAVEKILNCIYTGQIVLSEDSLTEVLHAASMMQVTDVLIAATKYMHDTLSVSNCFLFKDLAILYSFEKSLELIDQFILKNVVEISYKDQFLELPLHDIEELLKSDDLNVFAEQNAFEIVFRWVSKDLEERQQYFPQLFKQVRLQFIPIKHVLKIIAKNELVKSFSECRDLIEDAFSFYISPCDDDSQKARKCEPDSLLCISCENSTPSSYNLTSKDWNNLQLSKSKNILKNCAVASNYSTTVFCGGHYSTKVMKLNEFRWMTLPSLNIARCGAAAVFQGSKLYVFGGEIIPIPTHQTFQPSQTNPSTFSFARSFEILYKSWKKTDSDWLMRSYFSAQTIEGKIYLIGGYKPTMSENIGLTSSSASISCKIPCKDSIIYFPEEDTWKTSGQLNVARASFGCAVHQSSIYVAGGVGKGESGVDSVEFKNQHDVTWTLCPSSINITGSLSSCFVRNRMYVAPNDTYSGKIIGLEFKKSDVEEVEMIENYNQKKFLVPFSEKNYSLVFT